LKLSIVMAVMHIMGRLGLWEPYLHFVQSVLNLLDRACEEEWGPLPLEGLYDIEEGKIIES